MDELNSGSHADSTDLSKTFDQDETFNKLRHFCETDQPRIQRLAEGMRCQYCGAVIERKQQT